MIEFRWVVFLALWTLLIGPVLDFCQQRASTAPQTVKTVTVKTRTGR